MAKKNAKPHICLICWDQSRAEQHAAALKRESYRVTLVTASLSGWIGYIRDLAVDAVVFDLDRLPSHGRQVGLHLCQARSTRHLPLVYLGGEPAKVDRIRTELPHATCAPWSDAGRAIQTAMVAASRASPVHLPFKERAGSSDLVHRLGLKAEVPVFFWGDADFLYETLAAAADNLIVTWAPARQLCLTLAVTRCAADVVAVFEKGAAGYAPGSSIWIIHPKQSGRYSTDFNQNDVRALGLSHGWVDYRVCAIDSDWSGLKFARRKPGQPLQPRSMKHVVKSTRP